MASLRVPPRAARYTPGLISPLAILSRLRVSRVCAGARATSTSVAPMLSSLIASGDFDNHTRVAKVGRSHRLRSNGPGKSGIILFTSRPILRGP
jgi:hypothetical protein